MKLSKQAQTSAERKSPYTCTDPGCGFWNVPMAENTAAQHIIITGHRIKKGEWQ